MTLEHGKTYKVAVADVVYPRQGMPPKLRIYNSAPKYMERTYRQARYICDGNKEVLIIRQGNSADFAVIERTERVKPIQRLYMPGDPL